MTFGFEHRVAGSQTFATRETSLRFSHEVTGNPVQYLYRVRGVPVSEAGTPFGALCTVVDSWSSQSVDSASAPPMPA